VEPGPCDLREMMVRACDEVRSRHNEAILDIEVPAKTYSVITDEARLSQVVANLLENAAKYGGDPPHITVTLAETGGMARIGVRDRGPGIPLEEQPRVFERFYRSPSVGTKKGFGVGLYLAREIVTQLGGTLSFASTPGEGTEFFILLPHRMPFED
jgi:signal transduction histidine kinase